MGQIFLSLGGVTLSPFKKEKNPAIRIWQRTHRQLRGGYRSGAPNTSAAPVPNSSSTVENNLISSEFVLSVPLICVTDSAWWWESPVSRQLAWQASPHPRSNFPILVPDFWVSLQEIPTSCLAILYTPPAHSLPGSLWDFHKGFFGIYKLPGPPVLYAHSLPPGTLRVWSSSWHLSSSHHQPQTTGGVTCVVPLPAGQFDQDTPPTMQCAWG